MIEDGSDRPRPSGIRSDFNPITVDQARYSEGLDRTIYAKKGSMMHL
jgi:hypothetical protein